jgi:selenocysteine lyase/cysteine desulfurase
VRAHNRALTLAARDALCDGLGARPGAPDAATGAMAAIPVRLPAAAVELQRALLRDGWEVALIDWPAHRATYLRVSSHLYNTLDDAQRLAAHLAALGVRGA